MRENIYDGDLERLYEANDALSDQLQYYKEANDILSENLTTVCKQRQEWRARALYYYRTICHIQDALDNLNTYFDLDGKPILNTKIGQSQEESEVREDVE